jgi:hypothetical protein
METIVKKQNFDILAKKILKSSIVEKAWYALESQAGQLATDFKLPVILDKNPLFWIPRIKHDLYNVDQSMEQDFICNEDGEVASRSCLVGFLVKLDSLLKNNREGFIYLSVGAQTRNEQKEIQGLREKIFLQLEIEVIHSDLVQSVKITADILKRVLAVLGVSFYTIKTQGLDRNWKRYNSGIEVYYRYYKDAIAGGGEFSKSARKFGLPEHLHASGAALGLSRIDGLMKSEI